MNIEELENFIVLLEQQYQEMVGALGDEHADTQSVLEKLKSVQADRHMQRAEYPQAMELLEWIVDYRKQQLGDGHAVTKDALDSIEYVKTRLEAEQKVIDMLQADMAEKKANPQQQEMIKNAIISEVYWQSGDKEEALLYIQKNCVDNTSNPHPYITQANYLHDLDRVDESMFCLEQALKIEPDNIEGNTLKAKILKGQGELN